MLIKGGGGSEHYKIIHNSHELPRRCIKKQITHINEIHSVSESAIWAISGPGRDQTHDPWICSKTINGKCAKD